MKNVVAIPFARKLEGRTNYRKRLTLLKSGMPRLVIRKTLTRIILQVVDFDVNGDMVRLTVTSDKLRKLGWKHSCKNIPAAYLSGLLIGKLALNAKVKCVVPDLGMQSVTYGGKIFAAIKGAKDAGLEVNVKDEVVPRNDALAGAHIANYSKLAKPVQFAKASKEVNKIMEDFERLKAALMESGEENHGNTK